MLLAWAEGTGWQKGGSLAWQLFDRDALPTGEAKQLPDLPAWSFAAAVALPDADFAILR